MARLIDADALVEDIESEINKKTKVILLADYNDYYCSGMRNAIRLVKRLPAQDPVKHGHWKRYDRWCNGYAYICSECGKRSSSNKDEHLEYCCHCGAKMDEKPGGDKVDEKKEQKE